MKQLFTLVLFAISFGLHAQSITNVGFTWSPSTLTVSAGTDIAITITGNHIMREVTEATWNANGTTSNGGFNFSAGNHTLNLATPGTYYYVCVPHVGMGMKGKIIVEDASGIGESGALQIFTITPNPASDELLVTVDGFANSVITLVDMQGREVLRHPLVKGNRIDITNVVEGNYTALLLNADGRVQQQRRLSVTH